MLQPSDGPAVLDKILRLRGAERGSLDTTRAVMCIALASHFDVEIYFLHILSIQKDEDICILFKDLPTHCFVVLEDIDAVGLRDPGYFHRKKKCIFPGPPNVPNGIGFQGGRIILMTKNFINKLDPVLIRPGRIDKKVYPGKLGQSAAKGIFLCLFKLVIRGVVNMRRIRWKYLTVDYN
ncbi:hypothetical protein F4801DRAFT_581831 [Xylaria longipes]|nr:hypothetical protein F4801DRAFT_581831 [Xylaria longipes]